MPQLTAIEAKRIWQQLIAEYMLSTFDYLGQVKFGKGGKMKSDRYGAYAFHCHFPLVREFKKRIKEA